MDLEALRRLCLALPHATEDIQWGNDLLFRVGQKMFAVASLDPASPYRVSFKCPSEDFAELTEREGIAPAPYLARYHWIALATFDAVPARELERMIRKSYELVYERLPEKTKARLSRAAGPEKRGRKAR